MLHPSNALAIPSTSQTGPGTLSRPWLSGSGTGTTGPQVSPDILTYCYASRMVYVTPGETYDDAIDIAQESFPELKDVERDRIILEIHVVIKKQQTHRTTEIGRTAWSAVVATLGRFEIVEIRVAGAPPNPETVVGLSQLNLAPYIPQVASSQSSSSSFATRVVDLLTPKSSRGRLSPQPYYEF